MLLILKKVKCVTCTTQEGNSQLLAMTRYHSNSWAMTSTLKTWLTFRDDSHRLGNSLGRDRVVTSDHDDLDTGWPALGHCVGHGRTGRVNHGHEADESQALDREVGVVAVELEAQGELVAGHEQVTESWGRKTKYYYSGTRNYLVETTIWIN